MVSFSSYMRGKKNWDSSEQELGMKALHLYLQKAGRLTDQNSIWQTIAWLIQKDDESQKYFINLMGDHISKLQDQVKQLQQEIQALKA